MLRHQQIQKMIIASMLLALALVLPFLTGQIQTIGNMLCPMHIPVLICGFVCGWQYGFAVGFVAPLLRSVIFGMPVMFPAAVCMAVELAVYGTVSGFAYKKLPRVPLSVYLALFAAMILGRIVWGAAMFVCVGMIGGTFTITAFIASAFTNAIPGIILQIVAIPALIILLERTGYLSKED